MVPDNAVKLARMEHPLRKGFEENLREAAYWQNASKAMQKILCSVLFVSESGDLLVMLHTSPIPPADWEAASRVIDDRYSDAYAGPISSISFETKIETCDYLNG